MKFALVFPCLLLVTTSIKPGFSKPAEPGFASQGIGRQCKVTTPAQVEEEKAAALKSGGKELPWSQSLIGMTKAEVIKVLIDPDNSQFNWTMLFYKDYAEGENIYIDISDTLKLIFKDNKVVMVYHDVFYASHAGVQPVAKWFDKNGVANPQPVMAKHNEKPEIVISHGMDWSAFLAEVKFQVKRKLLPGTKLHGLNIRLQIDKDGHIDPANVSLEHSSGDANVDRQALTAMKSLKLAPLTGRQRDLGLDMGFYLEKFLNSD